MTAPAPIPAVRSSATPRARQHVTRPNHDRAGFNNCSAAVGDHEESGNIVGTDLLSAPQNEEWDAGLAERHFIPKPESFRLLSPCGFDRQKRLFDLVVSGLILLAACPVMAVIAIAVKLCDGGPVFFRQVRVGKGGHPFALLKFRTMWTSANRYARTPANDDMDARVTPVGRLLRKSGLDELPQLWCVLRGEMSLVGPRPEMAFIVQDYGANEWRRLVVIPGLTGPWQLSAHRREPIHHHLEYDRLYIRHRSLAYDVRLIGQTAVHAVCSISTNLLLIMPRLLRRSVPQPVLARLPKINSRSY